MGQDEIDPIVTPAPRSGEAPLGRVQGQHEHWLRCLVVDERGELLSRVRPANLLDGALMLYATETPTAALGAFELWQPDVVLVQLEVARALDLLSALRALGEPSDFLPVVILLSREDAQHRAEALASGAADVIVGPFSISELDSRLRYLVRVRHLHARLEDQDRKLEERVCQRSHHLEQVALSTIDRLAQVGEFRDFTDEHVRRVGKVARGIANNLGLAADVANRIERAAPLHDLGKVAIPDRILLKPGPLTEDELAIMRTHTTIGARILEGSDSAVLQLAGTIAQYHHERWDGRGYGGLAGDSIPLAARIVAVADVFDALTHDRPYRRAWHVDAALDLIDFERGGCFDPDVVDAFQLLMAGPLEGANSRSVA